MVSSTRSAPIPLDIFGVEEEGSTLTISNSADYVNGWGGDHAASVASTATYSKGDAVWYRQRDGTHVAAKVVSVDVSVDPPSYGVAFSDGSQGVRETEAPRLQRRSPQDAPPAAVTNVHGSMAANSPATAATTDAEDEDFGEFAEAAVSSEPLPATSATAATRAPDLANGFHHAPQASPAAADALGHARQTSSTAPGHCWQGQEDTTPAAHSEQGWAWQGPEGAPAWQAPPGEQAGATGSTLSLAPVWGVHHGRMPAAVPAGDDSSMAFGAFTASACAEAQQQGTPRWAGANGFSAMPAPELQPAPRDNGNMLSAAAVWAGAQPAKEDQEGTPRWQGAKRHRVTPTSVLSLPPSDNGSSSSDEDFGDFKAAQQAGSVGAPAATDRSAPLPLSLFGEEEEGDPVGAATLPPVHDLALPWSGFPLQPAPCLEHPLQLGTDAAPPLSLPPSPGVQPGGAPPVVADSAEPAAHVSAVATGAPRSAAADTDSSANGAGAAACSASAGDGAFAGDQGQAAAAGALAIVGEEAAEVQEPHAPEEERAGPAAGASMSGDTSAEDLAAGASAHNPPGRLGIDWDSMDFSFAEDMDTAASGTHEPADASACAAESGGRWPDEPAAQPAAGSSAGFAAEAGSLGNAPSSGAVQEPLAAAEESLPGTTAEEEGSSWGEAPGTGQEDPSGGSDWEFGDFAAAAEEDAAALPQATAEESLHMSSLQDHSAAGADEPEAMHWGGPAENAPASGWGNSWGTAEGDQHLATSPGELQEDGGVHEAAAAGWGDSWHDGEAAHPLPSQPCPAASPEVLLEDGPEESTPQTSDATGWRYGEADAEPAAQQMPGPEVSEGTGWGRDGAGAVPESAAVLQQPAEPMMLAGGWGDDDWALAPAPPAQAAAPQGLEADQPDLWGILASLDGPSHGCSEASGGSRALPEAAEVDAAGRGAAPLEEAGAPDWGADRWRTWHLLMQAAASELELGSRLWAEGCVSGAGAPAELLSGDGWRRYVTALGHVHFVALVLKQAAASAAIAEDCSVEGDQTLKGWQRCLGHWQLSVPGRCSLAEAYAAVCAPASPVVPWAPAVHSAATRLSSSEAPAGQPQPQPVQGCCGISLLPLERFPGVPTVLCNGVHVLAPLANLWANRANIGSPTGTAFDPAAEQRNGMQ